MYITFVEELHLYHLFQLTVVEFLNIGCRVSDGVHSKPSHHNACRFYQFVIWCGNHMASFGKPGHQISSLFGQSLIFISLPIHFINVALKSEQRNAAVKLPAFYFLRMKSPMHTTGTKGLLVFNVGQITRSCSSIFITRFCYDRVWPSTYSSPG